MNVTFNMGAAREPQLATLDFHRYINIYSLENMKLMNRKQEVLFGGKQLKDNT